MSNPLPQVLLLGTGHTLNQVSALIPHPSLVVTTTSEEKCKTLCDAGLCAHLIRIEEQEEVHALFSRYPSLRSVVVSVPPLFSHGDRRSVVAPEVIEAAVRGARTVADVVRNSPVERLIYLSTTGVFGRENGDWVDETSETLGTSASSRARISTEKLFGALPQKVTILRPAAIYGCGRGLEFSLRQNRIPLIKGDRWSNRIHVLDLSRIIVALLEAPLESLPPLLCAVDDKPSLYSEVISAYCTALALPLPAEITVEEAREKGYHMLLSNQRISNALLKQWLNKPLHYPTYATAVAELFLERIEGNKANPPSCYSNRM